MLKCYKSLVAKIYEIEMCQNELFKIILTSCLTVLGGIVVFVMGQIITKFFIEPLHEQSKLIGEIAYSLIFYANLYSNPGIGNFEKIEEASKVLRQQASQLLEKSYVIKLSWLWELLGVIPKQQNIIAASKILIALSNFVLSSKVDPKISVDWANQIKNALYIRID